MELHQLRYFVAVAETGSFTRAAERCSVAQPSLSQQIQKLERFVRKPLFDRLGKRVRLTEAGQALLGRARDILAAVDETSRELREDGEPGRGKLSVGAIPTVGPYLLPPLLARFLRRYPQAEVQLREDVTAHLLTAVHDGELDLAILALPADDHQLAAEPVQTEPLLAGLPAGHRLARRKRLTLDELQDEPFLLLGDMHCLTDQVTTYCRQAFMPRVACQFVQLGTIQQMIALGLGVSLLPRMACKADREIAYRPLAEPQPTRTVGAVWHRQRYLSPTVRLFMAMLGVGGDVPVPRGCPTSSAAR